MYHSLTGKLVEKQLTHAVVDVQGVSFEVVVPLSTYTRLPSIGMEVKLLVHLHVREDAHQLFGFLTAEEKELFRLLLGVSGIGPKIALSILSGPPIGEFKKAVVEGNFAVLSSISGIGRKTAERLVVELREKIAVDGKTKKSETAPDFLGQEALASDSLQALVNLGYRRQEAQEALKKVLSRPRSRLYAVEEVIREALKVI